LTVAVIPAGVELAVCDGIFDGAIIFVGMGAVRKAAVINVGAQVAKETGDLFGNHVP
jgi:hypothetical protein